MTFVIEPPGRHEPSSGEAQRAFRKESERRSRKWNDARSSLGRDLGVVRAYVDESTDEKKRFAYAVAELIGSEEQWQGLELSARSFRTSQMMRCTIFASVMSFRRWHFGLLKPGT